MAAETENRITRDKNFHKRCYLRQTLKLQAI